MLLSRLRRRAGPSDRLSPAAALCGWPVLDSGGEVAGSIADVVIDLERGCIAYALVASGGFLGVGEKVAAVPWRALRSAGAHFVLLGSRAVLDSGPPLDSTQWPDGAAPWWHERVHAHFRTRPYWD